MSWEAHLSQQWKESSENQKENRRGSFDMDDEVELQLPDLARAPRLKQGLEYLQSALFPLYRERNTQAIESQVKHRTFAASAILSGITAILCAVLMLVISHLAPSLSLWLLLLESVAVIAAAIAVTMGLKLHYHHEWLSQRQAAERLRSLKFESLAWSELWSSFDDWKRLVNEEIESLKSLDVRSAENWAKAEDDVTPEPVAGIKAATDSELTMLAQYYRYKRVAFQQSYFDRVARRLHQAALGSRYRISLVCFFVSVGFALLHGMVGLYLIFSGMGSEHSEALVLPAELPESSTAFQLTSMVRVAGEETAVHSPDRHGTAWHNLEIVLIGLAALFPIIGFGFRAWEAAFEFPRSRNLFRAKSFALKEPLKDLAGYCDVKAQGEVSSERAMKLVEIIFLTEHFLRNEHREWCRLQMEAEWYI